MYRVTLVIVALVAGAGCARQSAADDRLGVSTPIAELTEIKLHQLPKYVEKGVQDLSAELAAAFGSGVQLVTATCDERPTWHDGKRVFHVSVKFTKPGEYFVRLKRVTPTGEKHVKRLRIRVAAEGGEQGKTVVHAIAQSEHTPVLVELNQLIVFTWTGAGGRRWVTNHEWRLDRIAILPQEIDLSRAHLLYLKWTGASRGSGFFRTTLVAVEIDFESRTMKRIDSVATVPDPMLPNEDHEISELIGAESEQPLADAEITQLDDLLRRWLATNPPQRFMGGLQGREDGFLEKLVVTTPARQLSVRGGAEHPFPPSEWQGLVNFLRYGARPGRLTSSLP